MPRPPNNKLIVSVEEHEWIAKVVIRKAKLAERLKDSSKLKRVMQNFGKKMESLVANPVDADDTERGLIINTTRNEVRNLQNIVQNYHAQLVAQVIPGYQARLKDAKEVDVKTYLTRAINQSNMLLELLNKIKRIVY